MPLAILGDKKKGLPKSSGPSSSQKRSSRWYTGNSPMLRCVPCSTVANSGRGEGGALAARGALAADCAAMAAVVATLAAAWASFTAWATLVVVVVQLASRKASGSEMRRRSVVMALDGDSWNKNGRWRWIYLHKRLSKP